MQHYLFVVAHPDDELLGAGASICELKKQGHRVSVCVLAADSPTRTDDFITTMKATHKLLGVDNTFLGQFRCSMLEKENRREMVHFIEDAIRATNATVLITHHPSDLHNDHRTVSGVCQEAARLPMRQAGYTGSAIVHFAFMEVPSATDFMLCDTECHFCPTFYIPVSGESVKKKIELLQMYENVVRNSPHPRSERVLTALAAIRGAACASEFAEAFETVYYIHH